MFGCLEAAQRGLSIGLGACRYSKRVLKDERPLLVITQGLSQEAEQRMGVMYENRRRVIWTMRRRQQG